MNLASDILYGILLVKPKSTLRSRSHYPMSPEKIREALFSVSVCDRPKVTDLNLPACANSPHAKWFLHKPCFPREVPLPLHLGQLSLLKTHTAPLPAAQGLPRSVGRWMCCEIFLKIHPRVDFPIVSPFYG